MKKFLIIASLIALVFSAQAQTVKTLTSGFGNATDTVVNTASKPITGTVLVGYYKAADITINCTKISGTVGGTATLQGSLDNVTWYNYPGASAFTLTDVATQTTSWHITDVSTKYLRVLFAGAGTMSNIVAGKYYVVKTTP